MQQAVTKRLYIGGLASNVSSEEIRDRFARFGKVDNLSLTSRIDELGNKFKTFAHLDLEGDETNIKKCFTTYQNAKWKGSVLQLQYAKESFQQKLDKEKKVEAEQQKEVLPEAKTSITSQTSRAELFEIKGPAVPGTPVPGKKDWVVGKYGRVLPVLKLKKSYKIKMIKYDPSKHCHAATVFKDDRLNEPSETSCNRLTWEINTPDNEITKKRKGNFPVTPCSAKKRKVESTDVSQTLKKLKEFQSVSDSSKKSHHLSLWKESEDVEIVKVGARNSNNTTKPNKSNRFDSDVESGSEETGMIVIGGLQTKKIYSTDSSKYASKNSNILPVLKSANKNSEISAAQPTNKNTNIKPVLQPVRNTNDVTGSKVTNKNSTEKIVTTLASKDSEKTVAKPGYKTSEIKTIARKLSKTEQSAIPGKKASSVDRSGVIKFDSPNKIQEFKGLGMLGLLSHCSRISEHVAGACVDSAANSKPLLADTSNGNTSALDASRTSSHGVCSTPSTGKANAIPEFYDLSMLSAVSAVTNHSPAQATTPVSTTNPKQKPSNLRQNQLFPVEINQSLSPTISTDVADSITDKGISKNYDSSSSADTDEIIARCKQRKGLTSPKLTKESQSAIPTISPSAGKYSLQAMSTIGQRLRATYADLSMSEFTAGIPEHSVQSSRGARPIKQDDTSDSYDSDLDSNDFALVAKKLAQKVVPSKIADKKRFGDKTTVTSFLAVTQDFTNTRSQNKQDTKAVRTNGGLAVTSAVPVKVKLVNGGLTVTRAEPVKMKSSTGELTVPSVVPVKVKSTTGELAVSPVVPVKVKSTTGGLTVTRAEPVKTKSSTGELTVPSVVPVKVKSTTGELAVPPVVPVKVKSTTGGLAVTRAEPVKVKSTTGELTVPSVVPVKVKSTTGGLAVTRAEPVKSKPSLPSKSSVNVSSHASKQAADNEKRLQAIKENMRLREVQQNINQKAFQNVDSKDGSFGKRVVFSSSDDEASEGEEVTGHAEKSGLHLFDSPDEDEDLDELFKSKPHFEGKKGEKLMKLDRKIGDPRFKLDAKFALSDSEDEVEMQNQKALNTTEVDKGLEEEKTTNLKVLENVIGKTTLDRFSEKLKRNTKHIIDMNAVRFDPTKIQNTAEVVSVEDKKRLQQDKMAATTLNDTEKKSGRVAESRIKSNLNEREQRPDQKTDKVKKIAEVGSGKQQNGTSDFKKLVKVQLKSERSLAKSSDTSTDKTVPVSSSKIQLSSSLVDLFKKNKKSLDNNGTETFSLLRQFDDEDDEMEDRALNKRKKDLTHKSPAPLSALFKKETEKAELACENKKALAKSSSVQFEENSSDEAMSDEEVTEAAETKEKRLSLPEDDFEDDSSEDEPLNKFDGMGLADGDKDAHDMEELINGGRVNVRYSKEQWLQRWEDIRPALIKMYKRKHKDALRSKRKNNEIKRKKDFLKNSKRHRWARKRVS